MAAADGHVNHCLTRIAGSFRGAEVADRRDPLDDPGGKRSRPPEGSAEAVGELRAPPLGNSVLPRPGVLWADWHEGRRRS